MQALLGTVVAVTCFGAAYAAHVVFPSEPPSEESVLLSQSTIGTVNLLNKESLRQAGSTPKDWIALYLARKANLEDVLELVTGKTTVKAAYATLKTLPPSAETRFLIKAAEDNYAAKADAPKDERQVAASPAVSRRGSIQ
jgi:hypothetical protein